MILFLIMIFAHNVTCDELTQVVVFSRHNIRTPLIHSMSCTSKEWPKWIQEPGLLTTKGALLEEYFGEFFYKYFIKEKLVTDECPDESSVYVYANVLQRTKMTARHFIRSAFKQCNVTVHFKHNVTSDPIFSNVVLNDTESFQTIAREEMQKKLNKLDLKDIYMRLNTILDIETSDSCKQNGLCDLTEENDNITLIYGDEPHVLGPFKIANDIADAFLMAYYNGESLSNIGWGLLQPEDWQLLGKLTSWSQSVRFGCREVAKSIAKPLLNFIKRIFLEKKHKITILFGHDSNIFSILASIDIKHYQLEDQNEQAPIGGKVVFEKWYNGVDYYIKLRYIYLSTEQIRSGARLSKDNQIRKAVLELKNVEVNSDGHASFAEFMKILNNF